MRYIYAEYQGKSAIYSFNKTKEWDILSERIMSVEHDKLEQISHYITEKAAKGFAKKTLPGNDKDLWCHGDAHQGCSLSFPESLESKCFFPFV